MPHRSPALIANLLAQIGFGLLAMTLCLPSMQEWAGIFSVPQASVQLTFSVFVVAYGGFQLLFGPLSDRWGRRRTLMLGLVVAFVGAVLAALATNIELLVVGRFLQGAGGAAGMVVGRSMVQDLFEGPARTRVMAYVGMAMGCIPPTSTLLGGQLHVHAGWQWNFVLIACLAVALWFWAWRGLPVGAPRGPHASGMFGFLHAYARLMQERVFLKYLVILSVTTATFYAFLSGAPLVLASYGVGPESVGLFIMCIPFSYIVGNFLTTRWIHTWGERRVMTLGQCSTVLGIVLMLLLSLTPWHSPWAVSLPLILAGLGHGLLVPPTLTATVAVVPALAGAAAGSVGVMQQLTGALGGYAVGFVPHDGPAGMGWLMLTFASIGASMHVWLGRKKSPHTV
jgi:DHA1 family bicyclomycin/chloramphenicol resistance-like MFS transporter